MARLAMSFARRGRIGVAVLLAAGARAALCAAQEPDRGAESLEAALEQADQRFVQKDFAGALAILEPACAGSEQPACLFGLGAIQHALGHCEAAVGYYQRYRELSPQGEHMPEVLLALEQLLPSCLPSTPAPVGVGPTPDSTVLGRAAANGAAADGAAADGPATNGASLAPAVPRIIPSPFWQEHPAAWSDAAARWDESAHSKHLTLLASLLGLAGGTAVTAITLGALALNGAHDCAHRDVYDRRYRDLCETKEPRYRSLTLGFGLATGALLAGGALVWWWDESADAALGSLLDGSVGIQYRRRF